MVNISIRTCGQWGLNTPTSPIFRGSGGGISWSDVHNQMAPVPSKGGMLGIKVVDGCGGEGIVGLGL